jgi:hypothetical protein
MPLPIAGKRIAKIVVQNCNELLPKLVVEMIVLLPMNSVSFFSGFQILHIESLDHLGMGEKIIIRELAAATAGSFGVFGLYPDSVIRRQ